jgi:hypothetical protein
MIHEAALTQIENCSVDLSLLPACTVLQERLEVLRCGVATQGHHKFYCVNYVSPATHKIGVADSFYREYHIVLI